jgi:hypothetical protein
MTDSPTSVADGIAAGVATTQPVMERLVSPLARWWAHPGLEPGTCGLRVW